jgi:protein-tyrosine phosphatase
MIDLHSHILPGIDDGAPDLSASLEMARAFVADGVEIVACTPHILPGLYPNSGPDILTRIAALQMAVAESGIPLTLVAGSDAHMTPDLVANLRSGKALSIASTRYVLVEPPHRVAPPRIEDFFFNLTVAGYVPILTHPERLTWIEQQYPTILRLLQAGVWMQITAGSLVGAFGRTPKYWAERMLDEGAVHILASDSHDTLRRPPNLSAGREAAAKRVGEEEARQLVDIRPRGILDNVAPDRLSPPHGAHFEARNDDGTHGQSDGLAGGSRHGDRHSAGGGLRIADRLRKLFR